MSLQDTPRANRLHIGIFGRVNSGKSSLINALTKQNVAVVSEMKGTTTDPVYKAMEINGVGPVVFIDTAGFADTSLLGEKRLTKTREAADKTDIAIVLFTQRHMEEELKWVRYFKQKGVPTIPIINKIDVLDSIEDILSNLEKEGLHPLCISASQNKGITQVKDEIIRMLPQDYELESIMGNLIKKNELVLLVMPQDIQAPKGRLILPQVQTIRDILDRECVVVCCTCDQFTVALEKLASTPDLIICDSQVFKMVYEQKPKECRLTSFSVLFAHYKGDIDTFIEGAKAFNTLASDAHILIAEACTHVPLQEDIGRIKIPNMLKERYNNIQIEVVSGNDFPADLSGYDLIIHCGACMFNRKYVLHRIEQAKQQGIPITNYGVCIAYLNHMLDKIVLP